MTTNQPSPVEPAELTDQELLRTYNEELVQTYNARNYINEERVRAATIAGLRAVIAADRAGRPAPSAEGEGGELVAWLQQRCQLMSEAPGSEFHLFTRAADLLKQQAAELAECREALRRVRLQERIPGGGW